MGEARREVVAWGGSSEAEEGWEGRVGSGAAPGVGDSVLSHFTSCTGTSLEAGAGHSCLRPAAAGHWSPSFPPAFRPTPLGDAPSLFFGRAGALTLYHESVTQVPAAFSLVPSILKPQCEMGRGTQSPQTPRVLPSPHTAPAPGWCRWSSRAPFSGRRGHGERLAPHEWGR